MGPPLLRLHCLLKRAHMLLLCLGVAYLMAGSVLLLQRCSGRPGAAAGPPPPPPLALAAPPAAAPRAAGLGVRARSRWAPAPAPAAAAAAVSGGGARPASRGLGVQHLHRRWFHSLMPESPEQQVSAHLDGKHKGTYVGCFLHNASQRALGGTMLYDLRKMTSALCQDTCMESGYQFAGLEFGAECHCGNRISSRRAPEEDCSVACRGERGAPCGGVGRLSVYKVEERLPGQRRFKNVHYRGCFALPRRAVAAFPASSVQPNLTTQSCIETCTDQEFPLAVLRRPRCFCTWTSALFDLDRRSDDRRCAGANRTGTARTGTDRTGTGTDRTGTDRTGANRTGTNRTGADRTGADRTGTDGTGTDRTATASPAPAEPDHYQVYHTPLLDSRCRERMFLPQRSGSLVALSSFPGAGNTWVRHLIELVTGYYTGSFYFDGTLYNRGFKGEKDYWRSGRSICVKTHESGRKDVDVFDSAILLIRNPYRSLVAEFNRKCAGHLGHATAAQWGSTEWPDFVSSYAPWWASHALSWLRFGRRLLVVHYEELQRALLPQLRAIAAFLNATLTEERLLCAQTNQDGHFKRPGARRGAAAAADDPFTPDMRRTIDALIVAVDEALRSRNLSRLPDDYLPR